MAKKAITIKELAEQLNRWLEDYPDGGNCPVRFLDNNYKEWNVEEGIIHDCILVGGQPDGVILG